MANTSVSDVWDQDQPGKERASGSMFVKRTPNLKQAAEVKVVRDDWDDDDDDDDDDEVQEGNVDVTKVRDGSAKASGTGKNECTAPSPRALGRGEREAEEDSSKIWEEANRRAPMPELIVASASTSQSLPPPPPAALQPTLRILKRPSPNTSANNNNVGMASPTSLASTSTSSSGFGSGATSPAQRGTLAEREAQYQEARSRIFGEKERPGSTSSSSGGVVITRDPLGPVSEPELEPGEGAQDKAHIPGRPAKGFGERRRGKKG